MTLIQRARLRAGQQWLIFCGLAVLIFTTMSLRAPGQETNEEAQSPVIRSIRFEGLKSVEPERVLRLLPVTEGQPMERLAPGQLIRDIYATGFFRSDIRVLQEEAGPGAMDLIIHVRENPTIGQITVVGAQRITEKRLLKVIQRLYKEKDILKTGGEEDIRKAVEKEYSLKGFNDAVIVVNSAPDPADPEKVTLEVAVTEGGRKVLKDVIIEGNENMSGFMLRLGMNNKGSWWPLTNYFDKQSMEEDLKRIEYRYTNKGYLDVSVKLGEMRTGGEGKKAWISPVIQIEEGQRYKISSVSIDGAMNRGELEIRDQFQPLIGRYYSGKKLVEAIDEVKNDYWDDGFMDVEIQPEPVLDRETGNVAITFRINEQNRVRVGKIRVKRTMDFEDESDSWWRRFYDRIAPRVKDEAILKEVELTQGDVYRGYNEARTVRNLERLGIFESVQIQREPAGEDSTVSNVTVEVDDSAPSGRYSIGIGYGDVTKGFVYVSYIERNLFGDARDLSAYAMVGMEAQNVSVTYTDRHLGDSDFSLSTEGFYERYRRVGYDEQQAGGAVSLGHPFGLDDRYNIRLKAYQVWLDPDRDNDKTEEDLDKDYFVATLRPSVIFDRRDDLYFPTRGYRAEFGVEGGYADGGLGKLESQLSGYVPLPVEFVYATNLSMGVMATDAEDVGISERYFLGGSHSMRGYEFRGAGPKDRLDDDVAIGGATMLLWTNELRYPFTKSLSAHVFHDFGLIGRKPFDSDSPRNSVGVGGRYRIPLVTVSIDFGFALDETDTDETEIFHFQMGSRF